MRKRGLITKKRAINWFIFFVLILMILLFFILKFNLTGRVVDDLKYGTQSTTYSLCYQETANASSARDGSCGLDYSGRYELIGFWNNPNNTYDGNWSTMGLSAGGFIYINYTKPFGAQQNSLWQIKDLGISNLTILQSCWDYDSLILQLRVSATDTGGEWDCNNGTWASLRTVGIGTAIYEEAMIWNISTTINSLPNAPVVAINSTDGKNLTQSDLNCYASITDIDLDLLNVSVVWFKNNIVNLSFDYNNSYSNGTEFNAILKSGNLSSGDNWKCGINLFDGTNYSGIVNSTGLVIINPVNYTWCYQETANVSNVRDGNCGLDYSGSYGSSGTWTDLNNAYDGNWSTFASGYCQDVTLYINYSKPINALNNSLWNITNPKIIPLICFNQSILQFKIEVFDSTCEGSTTSKNSCWNGTGWSLIDTGSNFGVYEEAMIWSVSNTSSNSSEDFNLSSCQKINRSGVYTMNRNLNESDINSTGCFNITTSNVELNCNGYIIRNTTLAKPGIYAGSENGISNITIKNCNVSMNTSLGGFGIQFHKVNNSLIFNNTAISSFVGIALWTDSYNNQIINNTASANLDGIDLVGSSNNNLTGNTVTLNNYSAMWISGSSNNQITNNNISSNSAQGISNGNGICLYSGSTNNLVMGNILNLNYPYGIDFSSSSNNQIINNTMDSNLVSGISLESSSNNSFINNNIWNCTNTTYGCLYIFSNSQNNTFSGGVINLSSKNLIYLTGNSSNNIFRDLTLIELTNNDTYLNENSINNTFINVNYNSLKEYVEIGSELIRKWYFNLNVTNGASPLSYVAISMFNVSSSLQFSENTLGDGTILQKELIEYVNNGNLSYYSNYTVNATKTGYYSNFTFVNLTENKNLVMSLSLIPSSHVNDSSNNQNPGGGGSVGSNVVFITVFWKNTIDTTTDSKNNLTLGYSLDLGVQERVKMNLDSGESHYVGTVSISSDNESAVISIMSTPQNVTFKVGEEKKFELDNDEYYDLYVKLNNIVNKKANVTVKNIHEKITGDAVLVNENKTAITNNTQVESPKENPDSIITIWLKVCLIIIIVLVISLIIIAYYLNAIQKKNEIINKAN
ncbi:Right handed beta helix region [uncultured archaeon]|nr:Right handed beta helix region [uncultured archaeon]